MQKELVSIVVPLYQCKKYINRIVKALLSQTYRPIEIILVDDGSTDGGEELCDVWSQRCEEIKVVHRPHQGVSDARNYGIKMARGKYIQFIDADDIPYKTMTEKLVQTIEHTDSHMAACGYEVKDGNHNRKVCYEALEGDVTLSKTNGLHKIISSDLLCITWNKLYIREKIRHLYDTELKLSEDSVFCLTYFMDNSKVAVCHEVLYCYYVNHGSRERKQSRVHSFSGLKQVYRLNQKLVRCVPDKKERRRVEEHVEKVFFYGMYTYILEEIPFCKISRNNKIEWIRTIIEDKTYAGIVKKIKRVYLKEWCYQKASVWKMPEFLYFLVCLRAMLLKKGKRHV